MNVSDIVQRTYGPEISVLPFLSSSLQEKKLQLASNFQLNPRSDGRSPVDRRPTSKINRRHKIVIHINILENNAVLLECGETKLYATLEGPLPLNKKKQLPDRCIFQALIQYLSFASSESTTADLSIIEKRNWDIQQLVEAALLPYLGLEKYPRSIIICHITVLQDEGNIISNAILAASMAIIAHGILPIIDIIVSEEFLLVRNNHDNDAVIQMYIDPSKDENNCKDTKICGHILVSASPMRGSLSQLHLIRGNIDSFDILTHTFSMIKPLYNYCQQVLIDFAQQKLINSSSND